MKKGFFLILILVFLLFFASIFLKFKNIDKKIKISQISFSYPKNIIDFKNLFTDYFFSTVKIKLSNYSNIDFKVNQIRCDLLTEKGNIFAEQTEPINKILSIPANSNVDIEIKFQIFYSNIVRLLEDNNIKKSFSEILKAIKNFKIGTNVWAKGFLVCENVTIPFNQQIEI